MEQQPSQLPQNSPAERPPPGPNPAVKWAVGITCLAVLLVGGWWWVQGRSSGAARTTPGAGAKGPQAVPVAVATVLSKDVPIYMDGLGTVQAFNTVTVRSRVDGQLEKVAFLEGQDVRQGEVLAQIDPRPFKAALDQAIAKKAQDEAQLANARLQLARDKELLANKILAAQDYDTQKATVDQFEAAVQADQAAIDSAQVQLDYTTIRSPLDGRTGVRMVDQGNIVHANDSNGLVVITQLRPISVVFTLPQQQLIEIQKAMAGGERPVLAVDRDNSTVLDTGKLAVIDNQIDTSTGTIRLKATFPNESLRLWPGQFVNARLLLTVRRNGMVVPETVIQRGAGGAYAFVVTGTDDSLTAEVRQVTVAQIEGGEALVEAGLHPGERVVTEGQYRLQVGSRVRIRAQGQTAPAPGEEEGE